MLESSRRLTLPAGSNLRDPIDTSWFHLLPSLELGTVVCIGDPPSTVGRLLGVHADQLVVMEPASQDSMPTQITTCDLVVLTQVGSPALELAKSILTSAAAATAIIVVLNSQGSRARWTFRSARRLADRLDSSRDSRHDWVLLPSPRRQGRLTKRSLQAIQMATAHFGQIFRRDTPISGRHASDLNLHRPAPLKRWMSRRGTLLSSHHPSSMPVYLREVAARNGIDLDARSWRYGPARGYRSQKVVFTAVDKATNEDVIIKTAQESRFNERLSAEAAALETLHRAGIAGPLTIPGLLFADEHAKLRLVAEERLNGDPVRRVARPSPDDPHWAAVVEGLTLIASATARLAPADEVDSAVAALTATHRTLFPGPEYVTAGLAGIADRLGSIALPAVYQHGDLGVWNMVSTGTKGTVGVLDWENADGAGMPLWDLFVFGRTFGIFMADAAGLRYGASVFTRQLLEPSPLQSALGLATQRYCQELEIPEDAVADLFALCWAQQAVREAATLANPTWESARNNRYLDASLRQPFRLR